MFKRDPTTKTKQHLNSRSYPTELSTVSDASAHRRTFPALPRGVGWGHRNDLDLEKEQPGTMFDNNPSLFFFFFQRGITERAYRPSGSQLPHRNGEPFVPEGSPHHIIQYIPPHYNRCEYFKRGRSKFETDLSIPHIQTQDDSCARTFCRV